MVRRRLKTRKPVIAITCEVTKLRPYYSEFELGCDYRYVRAVIRAGGIPIMIPINHNKRDLSDLLDSVNGLLIIGGADIHPSFYGERTGHKIKPMYRGRTLFDMELYRIAQKKKVPVFAICYGLQLLNVIYGGTLYQDIQHEVRTARNHRTKRRHPLHPVTVTPGSEFAKIVRKKEFHVFSRHHQAVKKLGQALRITAYADDGIVEALEGPPRTLAVQWHPECQERDDVQRKIFRHFMGWAREHQKEMR